MIDPNDWNHAMNTSEQLQKLRQPFPDNQISLLPKPFKKDSDKGNCKVCGGYHGLPATHLSYVGHAALTDRLLEVDILWSWEPLAYDEHGLPRFDSIGGLWIKLTVCGHTRLGYGNAESSSYYKDTGSREKEVIGDALRNAAMRFGAALDLWHKGDLHQTNQEAPIKNYAPGASNEPPPPTEWPEASQPESIVDEIQPKGLGSTGYYVIKAGKFKSQALRDIPRFDLQSWYKYMLSTQDKPGGKPLSGPAKEACEMIDKYLNEPEPDTIPF